MSQENVEIIRSSYEAANRRDWDVAFRDLSPDVEWIPDRRVGEGPATITQKPSASAHRAARCWHRRNRRSGLG
jgi:ketosteroid isomerase-like protein